MAIWRRPFSDRKGDAPEAEERGRPNVDNGEELSDGSVHYVVGKAGNDSETSYQDTVGAPVEVHSPLGYTVGPVTIVFLNISKMIGTGIFSTRESSMLDCCWMCWSDATQHPTSSREPVASDSASSTGPWASLRPSRPFPSTSSSPRISPTARDPRSSI